MQPVEKQPSTPDLFENDQKEWNNMKLTQKSVTYRELN